MIQEFVARINELLEDPAVAGLRSQTRYESALGATVTPPAGTLRSDGRDVRGEFDLADGQQAVTLDSWGSQASRMEASLEGLADRINYPLIRFLDEEGGVLTTSVRLSHRHADATWRAARPQLEKAGVPFEDVREATVRDAGQLVRWFPTAPLFGWWHSHTPNAEKDKRTASVYDQQTAEAFSGYARIHADARAARLVTSEVIAVGTARRVRGRPGWTASSGLSRGARIGLRESRRGPVLWGSALCRR